jgi:general secretion pathway protein E
MYNRLRLGEILIKMEEIQFEDVERALSVQDEKGSRIGEVLVGLGVTGEESVMRALALQLDCPYREGIDVEDVDIALIESLQLAFCRDHCVLPFGREAGQILVATADPLGVYVLDKVRMMLGGEILPVVVPKTTLVQTINSAFDRKSRQLGADLDQLDEAETPYAEESALDINDLLEAGADDEAPVIRFVNNLFVQAVRERASDIHIEPGEKEIKVRFRIDGVLKEVAAPPKRFQSSITTRVKIMASLNIAEKRLPLDGRIRIKMAGKDIDIRVATAPNVHGERVTMRLLDKSAMVLDVRKIGLAPDHQEQLLRIIRRPHGIVLVTGPTGSGKTTTLYSSLSEINSPEKNILTIEDPVEYQLPGISQMQINSKIQLSFSTGLRSYLRHDPDVIMVGEIRDGETAEMAIQASLTGHLVFSTLHTNDAAGAFTRLIDMGAEPFLVSSTVIAAIAQRLLRRLCPSCRVPFRPGVDELSQLNLTRADLAAKGVDVLYRASEEGCEECVQLGYRSRTAIYEVLEVNEEITHLVMERSDAGTIKRAAMAAGMRNLRDDGALKVLDGTTSIAEVMRVTQEELSAD